MWIFGKDRAAFPYEIDATSDEVAGDWIVRPCKNTKTGASYSAWVLSGSLERARAVVKRMKTLRHPNFVTYVDSHEVGDDVTLITEPAIPLNTYLRKNADSSNLTYLSSWGIYQVTKALAFFNKDCKLHHNNVRLSSVFVTPAGDWKLAGLELVQPADTAGDPPGDASVFWPPDKKRVDSWGLGCLIWEVYNSEALRSPGQLRQLGAIPGALLPQYSELLHPKAVRRVSVSDFLTRASAPGGFFDNFYVRSLLFLEEIQIKDKEEKLAFLAGLADDVAVFPDDVAKFKLLPHLMHFLQYGGAGAEVLTPLLRLGKLLDGAEFEQKVLPCLVKLFSSPDRATRVRLLEQLPNFVDNLPAKCVNDQIFQPVCHGFSDTNPLVREATIRAMVPLADKLSDRTLNEALPRHLTQLQVKDEQGGIRANATICLAKLAVRMSVRVRQGPLLNAFLKCTRDPYGPARRMAVVALATTLPCYTLKDSASKVLPCLAFLTVDPDREVRDETFRALHAVVTRLEKASCDPEVAEREDKAANTGGSSESGTAGVVAASAASAGTAALAWTNWAVSALSSKFIKGANAGAPGASDAAAGAAGTTGVIAPPKEDLEKARKEEKKAENFSDTGGIKKTDFVPETNRKPASAYNWDGSADSDKGSNGWDDFGDEEDEEDAWGSLDGPGKMTNETDQRKPSPPPFEEPKSNSLASSGSIRSAGNSSLGSRGAMKLGKKVTSSNVESHTKVSDRRDSKENDQLGQDGWDSWGSSGKSKAKDDGWGSGKLTEAKVDDFGDSSRKSKTKDDFGSNSRNSKAKDDRWGSGRMTEPRVGDSSRDSSSRKSKSKNDGWEQNMLHWGDGEDASGGDWDSWGGSRKEPSRKAKPGGKKEDDDWNAW